jgi:hypothetical protein
MPAKSHTRHWKDVQTTIATAAIVMTLGLWNLFAGPEKAVAVQAEKPTVPPIEPPLAAEEHLSMPQVKIMFTQVPQIVTAQQEQPAIKRKKKNNNNSGSSQSVTQTKSS